MCGLAIHKYQEQEGEIIYDKEFGYYYHEWCLEFANEEYERSKIYNDFVDSVW